MPTQTETYVSGNTTRLSSQSENPPANHEDSEMLALIRAARDALLSEASPNTSRVQAIRALSIASDWIAEYEHNFELRWKASQRAMKRWHTAHPLKQAVWPDHADLCVWLIDQTFDLREGLHGAHTLLHHLRKTQTYPRCCAADFSVKVEQWLDDPKIFPILHPKE